ELAAGMQLGHHDFGSAALGLVLVIPFDVNWNAAAIVGDRNGIVGMDGDVNFSAVASQRFVDGVVQHLENKVMQTGAVGGVADIHAGALAHRFQAFQDLDGGGAVLGRLRGLL